MFDGRPFAAVSHVSQLDICGVYSCLMVGHLRRLVMFESRPFAAVTHV